MMVNGTILLVSINMQLSMSLCIKIVALAGMIGLYGIMTTVVTGQMHMVHVKCQRQQRSLVTN